MQATWRESDWCDRIQTCQVSKTQEALDVYQTLSSFWGWGLGTRLGARARSSAQLMLSELSIMVATINNKLTGLPNKKFFIATRREAAFFQICPSCLQANEPE